MESIWINELEISSAKVASVDTEQFKAEFTVVGKNNLHLFSQFFQQSPLHLRVPSLGQDTDIKIVSHSSSYTEPLDDQTAIHFAFIYEPAANDAADDEWNAYVGTALVASQNWAKLRALAELLEERGILTQDEFQAQANHIFERDKEEMSTYITQGPDTGESN